MNPQTLGADRLVYFTDAVVAIAITLLVLPLVELVPDALARHESTAEILATHGGPLVAFLLSFVVIARFWVVHHRIFDCVERVDGRLIVLNLFWILTVVVLPFPTALTGTSADDPGTVRLYVGVTALNVLTVFVMVLLIVRNREIAPDPPQTRVVLGVGSAAVLLVVAFVFVLLQAHPSFLVMLVLLLSSPVERIWLAWRRRHDEAS